MKKILSIIFTAVVLVSCVDLDLEPVGVLTQDQVYSTDENAVAALNGVYQALTYTANEQSLYGRNLYFLTDMATDYAAAGAMASNFHVQSLSQMRYDANNDRVSLVWKQIYNGINRANIAIDHIPDIEGGNPALRRRLINEAKFIRALLYYTAVRLWGDVPLVLHPPVKLDNSELKAGRTDRETVYAQIIQDLTDAQELPDQYAGADIGRPTSGSAYALLADVYLTRKEYPNAETTARFIIENAGRWGYRLVDNFGDLFTKPDRKNGPEHVFSVQFENGQNGVPGSTGQTLATVSYYGPVGNEPPDIPASDAVGYDRFVYNETLRDTRRDVSYLKAVPASIAGGADYVFPRAVFIKYVSSLTNFRQRGGDPINFPVIRYSEVLLILAEAVNEQGVPTPEAYEAINQVRRRAFGKLPVDSPSPEADLSGLDQLQFRQAVRDERLFEFVQEGKRWFDLVRWGILAETIRNSGVAFKQSVADHYTLYPIPQEQRELNPDGLYQNPGY
jgi:hypothetical protein